MIILIKKPNAVAVSYPVGSGKIIQFKKVRRD